MDNPYLLTLVYFVVSIAIVLLGLIVFEWTTRKYKDWDEIENGNAAVALSVGGKIVGICIILAFSIYHSNDIGGTIIWGLLGTVLQIISYFLYDLFTRKFKVEVKLKEGNLAVGMISFCVSIGIALVIGASIT